MITWILAGLAHATDVVWIGDASQADIDDVRVAAGSKRGPLTPQQLIDAATAITPADDEAYTSLEKTLERVRGLEDRLDGEIIIMHDLDAAISAIPIVRNDRDRDRVYAALAYEGFAVNRYFSEDLGTEAAAAPYRRVFGSSVLVAPWVDAAGMAPEREVTPYEIAQAPHRTAFRGVQEQVATLGRATLDVRAVPEGVVLYLDGTKALVGNDHTIRVAVGRHWVHAIRKDAVAARWAVDVEPGVTEALAWPGTEAAWNELVMGLGTLVATPPGLAEALDAAGGEVWVARTGAKTPEIWRVTETRIEPIRLQARATKKKKPDVDVLTVSAGGGWLYSPDFYLDDPLTAPRTVATVNAGALGLGALWRHGLGPLRLGAGMDLLATMGDVHVAHYGGDATTSLRPHLFALVGYEQIGVTGGFLFPHHAALGLRGSWSVVGPISLTAHGVAGFGVSQTRDDGSIYEPGRLATAWITVDWNSD